MNLQKYVFFLLMAAVTSSGLMLAFMSRKPLCIDSKYVYEIDRVEAQRVAKAYRCTLGKPISFDLKFYENMPQLNRRLQAIESILDLLGLRLNTIRVSVSTEWPLLFRISNTHLFIGEKLMQAEGHLERGIIKIALIEKFGQVLGPDPVFMESLADFILYASAGSLRVEDPDLGKNLDINLKERWPLSARSFADQCLSEWRTSEQVSTCARLNRDPKWSKSETYNELDPWSFRSFYSTHLIKAYKSLSVRERLQFMEAFADIINQVSLDGESTATQAFVRFFDLAAQRVHGLQETYPLIRDKIEDITKMKFQMDFLFLTSVTPQYLKDLSDSFEDSDLLDHQNVGVSDSKKLWMLPQSRGLNIGVTRELSVRQLVIEICEPLKNESLMAYSKFAQRLLLVRRCSTGSPVNYVSLVRGGIQAFAAHNKQLSFVQIHLGSLSMVLSKGIDNIDFFKLLSGQSWGHQLFKQIGWQTPSWVESTRAFKASANVEAIESYRPIVE